MPTLRLLKGQKKPTQVTDLYAPAMMGGIPEGLNPIAIEHVMKRLGLSMAAGEGPLVEHLTQKVSPWVTQAMTSMHLPREMQELMKYLPLIPVK